MNKLGGDKRFVRLPVNEDVGVLTNDMVDIVQGRVMIGLRNLRSTRVRRSRCTRVA